MDAADIAAGRERWQRRYDAARKRDADFTTLSGSPVDPVYGPPDGATHPDFERIGCDLQQRYDPSNPAANADGYVKLPNVNSLVEVMDMREAERSYNANLSVMQATRSMLTRTIDLLFGDVEMVRQCAPHIRRQEILRRTLLSIRALQHLDERIELAVERGEARIDIRDSCGRRFRLHSSREGLAELRA